MENTNQNTETIDIPMPGIFMGEGIKNKFMDVSFGPLDEQLLDIYLPDEPQGRLPVIFYVHGGGWTIGTKNDCYVDAIIDLIHHGYALISVNYRLAPATQFPGCLLDVKAAVRWARAHADEYGFDPDRFGMMGDSAGGHLTLMTGFSADHPEYKQYGNEEYSDRVQAIINAFGISLVSASKIEESYKESGVAPLLFGGFPISEFLRITFGNNDILNEVTSPIRYITKDAPPVLSLHGKLDPVVPYQQSVLVHEKVTEICGPGRSELILYEDRTHEDVKFNGGNGQTGDLCDTAAAFFDRYLK